MKTKERASRSRSPSLPMSWPPPMLGNERGRERKAKSPRPESRRKRSARTTGVVPPIAIPILVRARRSAIASPISRSLARREDFASKMASFVGDRAPEANASAASLAPFVDYAPALELYRAILREDQAYEHRDAVLFHTGMILSDQGDPAARAHLEELVSNYPSSPFCGRASLRMGDDDFEQHRLASAATQFESAAAKGDDEVRTIALYKLGWVFFNLDRFDSAAGSFFQLLDLYEKNPDALALDRFARRGRRIADSIAGAWRRGPIILQDVRQRNRT